MKRMNIIKTLTLAAVLSSASTMIPNAVFADSYTWHSSNGNWYYTSDAGINKTGWYQTGDGNWYYSYSNGQMAHDTTIDGYYVNSNGAWSLNRKVTSDNAIVPEDLRGNGYIRDDINSTEEDYQVQAQLNNNNGSVIFNKEYERMIFHACTDLAQRKNTIENLKNNCIGKVIDSKYRIKNIIYLDNVFQRSGEIIKDFDPIQYKLDKINNSDLTSYVPSSTYVYDKYLVFTGVQLNNTWEAMRIIIELEVI